MSGSRKWPSSTRKSTTKPTSRSLHFLNKDQVQRLHQIQLQFQGAQAFSDEHVQTRLKLTDAQKSEIAAINTEAREKLRSVFQDTQGDREAAMAKITDLRKETLIKIESKLTDQQKTIWKEFLGRPFDIKFSVDGPPPGGGRDSATHRGGGAGGTSSHADSPSDPGTCTVGDG